MRNLNLPSSRNPRPFKPCGMQALHTKLCTKALVPPHVSQLCSELVPYWLLCKTVCCPHGWKKAEALLLSVPVE